MDLGCRVLVGTLVRPAGCPFQHSEDDTQSKGALSAQVTWCPDVPRLGLSFSPLKMIPYVLRC